MAERKKTESENKIEIKKVVKAGSNYVGANVRDKEGKIISYIPNGKQVTVTGSFDPKKERTEIIGKDDTGKEVKGTVLTSTPH